MPTTGRGPASTRGSRGARHRRSRESQESAARRASGASSSISSCRRLPNGAIDGRERLVEQQHRRLASQRSRERDALTLAARQFAWSVRSCPDKVHRIQQFRRPRAPLGRRRCPSAVMTLPSAVRCGKSAYSWNTNPTARRCGGENTPHPCPSRCRAPDRTRPCAGRERPAIARRIVVLPLPDGPKIART